MPGFAGLNGAATCADVSFAERPSVEGSRAAGRPSDVVLVGRRMGGCTHFALLLCVDKGPVGAAAWASSMRRRVLVGGFEGMQTQGRKNMERFPSFWEGGRRCAAVCCSGAAAWPYPGWSLDAVFKQDGASLSLPMATWPAPPGSLNHLRKSLTGSTRTGPTSRYLALFPQPPAR